MLLIRTAALGLLLCLAPFSARAALPLEIGTCGDFCYLGEYIEIFIDKDGTLTIDEVLSPEISAKFEPSETDVPNFSRSYATYWVRFKIENQHATDANKWLVLDPFMVTADLYRINSDGEYELKHFGAELPLAQRDVFNVRPIIELDIPQGQSQDYYLKVKTLMGRIKLELWAMDAFAQNESLHQYVYGIWLGCMLASFFFNLFIFFSVRDSSYLYYLLYLSGITLSQLGFSGHSHFIFPPWLSVKSLFLFGAFYGIWGLQFSKSFLQTQVYLPRTHKVLNGLMAAFGIPLIMILTGIEVEGSILLNLLGIIASVVGLYIGIASLLKGYQPALIYLLAFSFLLAGILIQLLGAFGLLPLNFLTEYGIRIGSTLQVILLSFALVDRIHRIKAQRERALKLQLAQSQKLADLGNTFKKFVPHEFIECLSKNSIVDVKLGDNSQREMSILFSDIRSFTVLSERMTPEENFRFINSYLRRMEPSIRKHDGFIDKYIGDSIMALFDKQADDAVHAAIDMLHTIPEYNHHRSKMGYAPIRIGIGINTGKLMIGTIGGEKRMESTVISDAVNFASRIENMTKYYGASLLISEHTYWKLKDPSRYQLRILGLSAIKGKTEPVTVFEVLDGEPEEIREEKLMTQNKFEEAIALFELGEYDQTQKIMKEILRKSPGDKAAQTYIERCNQRMKA